MQLLCFFKSIVVSTANGHLWIVTPWHSGSDTTYQCVQKLTQQQAIHHVYTNLIIQLPWTATDQICWQRKYRNGDIRTFLHVKTQNKKRRNITTPNDLLHWPNSTFQSRSTKISHTFNHKCFHAIFNMSLFFCPQNTIQKVMLSPYHVLFHDASWGFNHIHGQCKLVKVQLKNKRPTWCH